MNIPTLSSIKAKVEAYFNLRHSLYTYEYLRLKAKTGFEKGKWRPQAESDYKGLRKPPKKITRHNEVLLSWAYNMYKGENTRIIIGESKKWSER